MAPEPMPTFLTHAAVPLAAGLGLGERVIPERLLQAGVLASMLPDLDVIGFRFGIDYGSQFGHRGFTHSLCFALAVALVGTGACRYLRSNAAKAFLFLFAVTASHGLLDCFTNGGLGIALLWPASNERFFAPFQVIEVSPLGLSAFLSPRGAAVLASEAVWVWLPCLFLGAVLWICTRKQRYRGADAHRQISRAGDPP